MRQARNRPQAYPSSGVGPRMQSTINASSKGLGLTPCVAFAQLGKMLANSSGFLRTNKSIDGAFRA